MKKRGISHIEVILSFLIFIGFVIFGLYFFTPFESNRLIESSLIYVVDEIVENTSVELDVYSIKIYSDAEDEPEDILEITISEVDFNKVVRAENYFGKEIPSRREQNNPDVVRIKISQDIFEGFESSDGFILLKFSEDMTPYSISTELDGDVINSIGGDLYQIGSLNNMEILSEKRVEDLKNLYSLNDDEYFILKDRFNIPRRVNFGFSVLFEGGEIIESMREIPKGIEIFSEKKRGEILRSSPTNSGKIEYADLIINIW